MLVQSFEAAALEWRDVPLGVVDLSDGDLVLDVTAASSAGENGIVCHVGLDHLRLEPAP